MKIFRNTFNEKRDWRMRFYNGSAICDINEMGNLDIQEDEVQLLINIFFNNKNF